ncbi:MAG TPA: N-acetylglucosamine-6-phosphate deacetylase [Gaiellaceae bacterium]|nr:N-acetylglucosamine-6-phosphate deacetylase [Gaiellaceae bacterium]
MRLGVSAALVGGTFVPGDVEVEEGRLAAFGVASANGRGIAVPGFVDLQVNGFAGVDFLGADADAYARAGEALLETGVTAYLATFITSPEDVLVEALRGLPADTAGPRVLGAHVEGPFLSALRLGTHPPEARRDPDPVLLARILDAGRVRLVTLAPELPGALGLVDQLVGRGVVVSCGHSDASAVQAEAAFARGAAAVTHLFNAMRPFSHRDPGIAGAALTHPGVTVQLIVDGVHLAREAVLLAWSSARGRVALVTDAVAGAGLGDGSYALGDVTIEVENGVVRREDGVLAGSALTMVEAIRNVHRLGVPLEEAVLAASAVPARLLGEPGLGRLEVGLPADVVVLDDSLEIVRTVVAGETRVAC